jgi:hypothetical protein
MHLSRGVSGYKIPAHTKSFQENLLHWILKVAKEQGECYPGSKCMIFTTEKTGFGKNQMSFKMLDIEN